MKTVGVIGGMGPAATADFFTRMIRATPATRDQDHLHLIINSDPTVPDRNRAIGGTGPSSGPTMGEMAQALERAGADFLVIACNTAHAFLEDVQKATSLPVLDMVAETVAAISWRYPDSRKIGLLAVDGCLKARLYQRALNRRSLEPVVLSKADQADFMDLIYRLKAGDDVAGLKSDMLRAVDQLLAQGAEVIVAACTEVPIVIDCADSVIPIVASTDVLVARTISFARETGDWPSDTRTGVFV